MVSWITSLISWVFNLPQLMILVLSLCVYLIFKRLGTIRHHFFVVVGYVILVTLTWLLLGILASCELIPGWVNFDVAMSVACFVWFVGFVQTYFYLCQKLYYEQMFQILFHIKRVDVITPKKMHMNWYDYTESTPKPGYKRFLSQLKSLVAKRLLDCELQDENLNNMNTIYQTNMDK